MRLPSRSAPRSPPERRSARPRAHPPRRKPNALQSGSAQAHGDARRAGRRFHLHIGRAAHRGQCARDLARLASSGSRSSPKTFTTTGAVSPESVSPMRSPRKVSTSALDAGELRQHLADLGLHHFLVAVVRFQIDVKLALVRSPACPRPAPRVRLCCSTVAMCGISSSASETWRPSRSDSCERSAGQQS